MTEDHTYRLPTKPEKQNFALGLDLGQVGCVVASCATGLIITSGSNFWTGLTITLFLVVATVPQPVGLPLVAWLPKELRRTYRQVTSPGVERASLPATEGVISPPRPVKNYGFIEADMAGNPLGVLFDPGRRLYIACVETVSLLPFLMSDNQEFQQEHYGRTMDWIGRTDSPIEYIFWMEVTHPQDASKYVKHAHRYGDREAGDAERDYLETLQRIHGATSRHVTYTGLVLRANRSNKAAIKHHGKGHVAAANLLAAEMAELAERQEYSGLKVKRIPDPDELATEIRMAYEPDAILPPGGAGVANAWPTAVDDKPRNYYYTDGAYHKSFWFAEFPRAEVGPDWMANLLIGNETKRRLLWIARPYDMLWGRIQTTAALVNEQAEREKRAGRIERGEQRIQAGAVEQREEELTAGRSQQQYKMFATLTAKSEDQANLDSRKFRGEAARAGCQVKRLFGRHDEGFHWSMPFGLGM